MTITKASPNDILRWADGTTCYRSEWNSGHYACMSDDFEVITEESPEYAVIDAGGTGPGQSFMDPLWEQRKQTALPTADDGSLETSEREARLP